MSESDGLAKLAEYLTQTRRQAEQSIDILNTKIAELTNESETISSERDYFRNFSEQLKIENSKKWRLQERDDWKSLVDSVQRDRGRLQDDNSRLENELEEARAGVKVLEEEINLIMNSDSSQPETEEQYENGNEYGNYIEKMDSKDGGRDGSQGGQFDTDPRSVFLAGGGSGGGVSTPFSTSLRTPLKINISSEKQQWRTPSPRAVSLKLQVELQRALAKLEAERKLFAEEKIIKEQKILELEEEINQYKLKSPAAKKLISQIAKAQQSSSNYTKNNSHPINSKDTFNLFYSVPQNFFSFLFPPNAHKIQTQVLNV